MAIVAWPFDSTYTADQYGNPVYDRAYSSDVLATVLRKYFRDGVFTTAEDSFVVNTEPIPPMVPAGLFVTVNPGHCLIQGRHGYNEAQEYAYLEAAHASLDRIDRVVLRLDLSVGQRSIQIAVVTGTPAAEPAAPALTRNSTVYELCLANVYVDAGVLEILANKIDDKRLNDSLCGVVASIIGDTDTTTYYNQIAADLALFKANEQAAFLAWFTNVQNTLGEDTAGELLLLIQALQTNVFPNSDAIPVLGTLINNGEYRCRNLTLTTAPTMTLPEITTANTDEYASVVIFRAPNSTPPAVTNNSTRTLRYFGTHVRGGVFTPIAGYDYNMSFFWTGTFLECAVWGRKA